MAPGLSFREFQQFIRDNFYESDSKRGTGRTFMWLMEEVGELSSALQNAYPYLDSSESKDGDKKPIPGNIMRNLEDEFADVLGWLSTLANMHGVDLEKALHQKYLDNKTQGPYKK